MKGEPGAGLPPSRPGGRELRPDRFDGDYNGRGRATPRGGRARTGDIREVDFDIEEAGLVRQVRDKERAVRLALQAEGAVGLDCAWQSQRIRMGSPRIRMEDRGEIGHVCGAGGVWPAGAVAAVGSAVAGRVRLPVSFFLYSVQSPVDHFSQLRYTVLAF